MIPRRRASGFALIAVLVVLATLALIATPFAISMRMHAAGASRRRAEAQASIAASGLLARARARLAASDPAVDPDRHWDLAAELDIPGGLPEAMRGVSGGGRLRTGLTVEDEQGKAYLPTISPLLLGNLLDLAATLAIDVEEDDDTLVLDDARGFPPSGVVWIEGELCRYASRTNTTLAGVERGMRDGEYGKEASGHRGGSVVLDLRVWAALRPDPLPPLPARIEELLGWRGSWGLRFTAQELERAEDAVTAAAGVAAPPLWSNEQALLAPLRAGESRDLRVANARYYGPGTVLRLRDGDVEDHVLVVAARGGGRIELERSVRFDFGIEGTRVASLLRRPVQVNTASRRVLRAILHRVGLRTTPPLDFATAAALADRMAGEDLRGPQDLLERVLDPLVERDLLDERLARAVFTNALHAGDARLAFGTAPLTYRSMGAFTMRARAEVDTAAGTSRARERVEEVGEAVPEGLLEDRLEDQRDFEEALRLSRSARHVATFPENLTMRGGGEVHNDPPSRFLPHYVLHLFPAEEAGTSWVQLEPSRTQDMPGMPFSVEHFDTDLWPEGRRIDEKNGVFPLNPSTGSSPAFRVRATAAGTGGARLSSGAVEFWWRREGEGVVTTASILQAPAANPAITLGVEDGAFVLRLRDNAAADPIAGTNELEVRYEHPAGPVTGDTWYHLLAGFAGTAPEDVVLLVDGWGRGRPSLQARLTGAVAGVAPLVPGLDPITGSVVPLAQPLPPNPTGGFTPPVPGSSLTIPVDSTKGFPDWGVLRIGQEVVEYTARTATSFVVLEPPVSTTTQAPPGPRATQRRGGRARRGTIPVAHPSGETVELLGYSCPLDGPIRSAALSLGGRLGAFRIARVANQEPLLWTPDPGDARDTGRGQGLHPATTRILLEDPLAVAGTPGPSTDFADAFEPNGGYALLIGDTADPTWDGRTIQGGGGGGTAFTGRIEFVHYDSVSSGANGWGLDVAGAVPGRGADTERFPHGPKPGFGTYSGATGFITRVALPQQPGQPQRFARVQTVWAIPISLTPAQGGALASIFPVPPAGEHERVQVGTYENAEWFAYDGFDRQGRSFLRDAFFATSSIQTNPLVTARNDILAAIRRGVDPSEDVRRTLRIRGWHDVHSLDDTGTFDHAASDPIRPVFRVIRGPSLGGGRPGRGDWITLLDPGTGGSSRTYQVAWGSSSFRVASPQSGSAQRIPIAYVGLDRDVQASVIPPLRQGLPQPFDPRRYPRIVKFPSGELPEVPGTGFRDFTFSSRQPATADEVGFFGLRERAGPRSEHGPQWILARELRPSDSHLSLDVNLLRTPYALVPVPAAGTALDAPDMLPDQGGLLQIGDEIVGYTKVIRATGEVTLAPGKAGRGLFGTKAGYHAPFEAVLPLPFLPVTALAGGMDAQTSRIPVQSTQGFGPEGVVRIDEELLLYTTLTGGEFRMPQRPPREGEIVRTGPEGPLGVGIFRGRYGTTPLGHASRALVFRMPVRYEDRHAERSDDPDLAFFEAVVSRSDARWEGLSWDEELPDPLVDLHVQVRAGGAPGWGAKEGLRFEDPAPRESPHPLGLEGSFVECRFGFAYRDGAYDPKGMTRQAWKRTPRLLALSLFSEAPGRVFRHEEGR